MKGLIIALQFLTRLPMPSVPVDSASFAASMRWFPVAGLAVGGVVAGAFWLGGRFDPWLAALAALVAWVWVTGALHLDGLSDLADARGAAHRDPERLLAVMADPHVGSFGVVALIVQLIAKLVLLHLLPPAQWPALLLIPAIARIGPLAWTRWLPSLRAGLAERFVGVASLPVLAIWAIGWTAACWFVPALLIAPLLILWWGLWLRDKLGGVSGDCLGAGVELVETGLLVAVILWAGLA